MSNSLASSPAAASITLVRCGDAHASSSQAWIFDGTYPIAIGRSGESHVLLAHPRVSRRHGIITYGEEGWIYTNVGSNSTYIQGAPVTRQPLHHLTVLEFSRNGPQLAALLDEPATIPKSATGSVSLLLAKMRSTVNQRDESVAQQLWNRYYHALIARARAPGIKHSDAEDIAAVALTDLLLGLQAGRFPELFDRESLWRLLVATARRRAIDQVRRDTAIKRGSGQVRLLADLRSPDDSDDALLCEAVSREPDPETFAALQEELRQCFSRLDTDEAKVVAHLKLEGFTNQEISDQLQIDIRTVERRMARIRRLWFGDAPDAPENHTRS